jgi:signal transduction histidine kinase
MRGRRGWGGEYFGTGRRGPARHTVSKVTLMAFDATTGDATSPDSQSRWEQMLLRLELGGLDNEDGDTIRTGPPAARSTRDWLVDGTLFAYATLSAIATVINDGSAVGTSMLVVEAALAAVALVALWGRRRWPLGVAWLSVVLSAVSGAAVHTAQVAVFSAAIHARPRRAAQVGAAGILATIAVCFIDAGTHRTGVFGWGFFAYWGASTVAALALGSFIRVRREQVMSLQQSARTARAEQQLRIREAQLAERTRIAREMHDVLAHRISLLAMHAGALEFNPDPTHEELTESLGVIRGNARAAQQELRSVLGVLRANPEHGVVDPPQPTAADLERLVEESRHAGMTVTVVDQRAPGALIGLAGRTVYRVVQEALTNVRKHAPTDTVTVSLTGAPGGTVEVTVVNLPQLGRTPDHPSDHSGAGTGLIGLAERLQLAGGTLSHHRRDDGGFELSARLPWPRAEQISEEPPR